MDCSANALNESVNVDDIDPNRLGESSTSDNEDGPTETKVSNKRSRNLSSSVWSYFDKVSVGVSHLWWVSYHTGDQF